MILLSYGTRPEWIKIRPVIKELEAQGKKFKVLFTGQHESLNEGRSDFSLKIDPSENRLDAILSSVLSQIDFALKDISKIMVQGDTATAFAVALAAFHRQIPILHLEAGMRTYDISQPYPEEAYRQMISRISSINFCPTDVERANLESEGVCGILEVVGNTVLDNLVGINSYYGNKIVVTLHRRENHPLMDKWFAEIDNVAKNYPGMEFVLPIHPNPNVIKWKRLLQHVHVVDPLPYSEMVNLLAGCRMIITDSGGLQEEGSFLNKKIIVCRSETERKNSLGIHSFLCSRPEALTKIFDENINNYEVDAPCPYGDGYSSQKIVSFI